MKPTALFLRGDEVVGQQEVATYADYQALCEHIGANQDDGTLDVVLAPYTHQCAVCERLFVEEALMAGPQSAWEVCSEPCRAKANPFTPNGDTP